ncbi:hypothetical protein M0R72_08905 [Candidatus Pacearchaeota archaeon]|jgi:Zn finger protein HypA/HybF involved in hydrogenase expression|nr:hypothetical protein [Candidatus Pacearchaeota archaeon]
MITWKCNKCGHVFDYHDLPVDQLVGCGKCLSGKLRAIAASPSRVTGVGLGPLLDLGLALLMEAQT